MAAKAPLSALSRTHENLLLTRVMERQVVARYFDESFQRKPMRAVRPFWEMESWT